ncbi:hypothetical protein Tco_0419272 [Tanacetum coccineum]
MIRMTPIGRFHGIKDAKTLWEAIMTRFQETHRTILEIHGEVISPGRCQNKLLRSLPLAWNNIALIMRNKSDLDTMSMDDLYNNLKVYEAEIKSQSSSSSNSQNVAFGAMLTMRGEESSYKEDRKESEFQWQRNFPPPYTGNYMPSRPDLSFAGLDDSVYKTNVSETITSVPRNESTSSKSSKDSLKQPKYVRPSAPIIEEWEFDCDDDFNAAKSKSSPRAATSISTARHVNTGNTASASKPKADQVSECLVSPKETNSLILSAGLSDIDVDFVALCWKVLKEERKF